MLKLIGSLCISLLVISSTSLAAQNVVEDQGVGLKYEELEYFVGQWTDQMRDVAANDAGDRLELLNKTLLNKKLAAEAEGVAEQLTGDAYWEYQMGLEAYKRNFVLRQFTSSLEVPALSGLAAERYGTEKEKYALVQERRTSSHILFAATPGMSRDEILVKAQGVLEELRAGADFEEYVNKYSEEPGAAGKKGKFNRWIGPGEKGVSPPYIGGLFEIANVGEYSELTQTQFGVHIIRLDGIEEAYFKPYDEVKAAIVADLENEYRKLAVKDFLAKFHFSDEVYIDGEAMDKLFAPYARK